MISGRARHGKRGRGRLPHATSYTPPAARRTVGLFGGKNARNLA